MVRLQRRATSLDERPGAPSPLGAARTGPAPGAPPGDRADRLVVVLALATVACTYALVVLGSTVRVTGSGMGCPGWPLCHGQVGPIDRFHALLEQSHRYLATLVVVGAAATALAARRSRTRRAALVPAVAAAGLVLVQAGLGALTVLAKNAPWTVSVHVVVGLVFLAVTVVTAVAALGARHGSWAPAGVGRWGWAALAAALAAIVAGSLVVGNGAGAACPSWPLCPPSATGLAVWQLVHRSLAGAAGAAAVAFVTTRWRTTAGRPVWRGVALASLGALALVAALGAASALTRAAAAWQDAHLAAVALFWALLVAAATALAIRGPRAPAGVAMGRGAGG